MRKCTKCWLYNLPMDRCLNGYHRSGILCGEKDVPCRAMRAVMKLSDKLAAMDEAYKGEWICPPGKDAGSCGMADAGAPPRTVCRDCWARWATR